MSRRTNGFQKHEAGNRRPERIFDRTRRWLLIGLLVPALSSAADRYWIGAGGNWSEIANWSVSSGGGGNASVPGTADTAIFDTNSGDCTVDVNADVNGVQMTADYTGTLSVTGSSTFQVRAAHYQQAGGAFTGGANTVTFRHGNFNLTGGTFTHTNGLTVFHNAGSSTAREIEGLPILGDVRFNTSGGGGTYPHTILAGSTVTVHGAVSFISDIGSSRINTGTLRVHGDVISQDLSLFSTAWLVLCGDGDQTVTGEGNGYLPNLRIDKPSGSVLFDKAPATARHIEHLAGGFDAGTSTVTWIFRKYFNSMITSATERLVFHDLRFRQTEGGGVDYYYALAPNLTVEVTNRLIFAGGGLRAVNGDVEIHGDVEATGDSYHLSSTRFRVIGDGDQTITAASGFLPSLIIDKPSGTLFLDGVLGFRQRSSAVADRLVFDHRAGTIDPGTSRFHLQTGYQHYTTVTSAVGTLTFHDLSFSQTGSGGTENIRIAPGTSLLATGTVSFGVIGATGAFALNGSLETRGHILNQGSTVSGTTVLNLRGDAVQEVDATGFENRTRLDLHVNKNGGEVRLVSDFELNQANRRLDVESGIFNIGTNILTFSGNDTVYSNSPDAELHLTLASTNTLIRQTGSGSQALINGKLFVERATGFVTPPEEDYMILESATAVDINPPHAPFETDGRSGEHTLLYDVLYNEGGNNIILANVRIARGMLIRFR